MNRIDAGIGTGHLHLFGESQNEIAASRHYGNPNNHGRRHEGWRPSRRESLRQFDAKALAAISAG